TILRHRACRKRPPELDRSSGIGRGRTVWLSNRKKHYDRSRRRWGIGHSCQPGLAAKPAETGLLIALLRWLCARTQPSLKPVLPSTPPLTEAQEKLPRRPGRHTEAEGWPMFPPGEG